MNLLLDTQAFLWFEVGDSRLSPIAVQAIKNPLNIKFISLASFWEIAIKNSIGKLELHVPFDDLFNLKGYSHLYISGEHLKVLRNIPLYHRDPFDRLIIAQALHEKFSVVGSDSHFDLYGVKRIW
jgi:PIN domain nuclease of toxin-antitoxin system